MTARQFTKYIQQYPWIMLISSQLPNIYLMLTHTPTNWTYTIGYILQGLRTCFFKIQDCELQDEFCLRVLFELWDLDIFGFFCHVRSKFKKQRSKSVHPVHATPPLSSSSTSYITSTVWEARKEKKESNRCQGKWRASLIEGAIKQFWSFHNDG